MRFTVKTDLSELEAVKEATTKANTILLSQVMKDTSPYVPFLTGSLNARTHVVGNTIIYPGPYARYLYYGKVMVDSVTGKARRKSLTSVIVSGAARHCGRRTGR